MSVRRRACSGQCRSSQAYFQWLCMVDIPAVTPDSICGKALFGLRVTAEDNKARMSPRVVQLLTSISNI